MHIGVAVVRGHDDRVALEEAVEAPDPVKKRGEVAVDPLQSSPGSLGSREVSREIEIGQVVEEEVERVAGDEMGSDGRTIGVDRAARPRS